MFEKLIDRMIALYGYEHTSVIFFCKMCEMWEETEENYIALEKYVKGCENANKI